MMDLELRLSVRGGAAGVPGAALEATSPLKLTFAPPRPILSSSDASLSPAASLALRGGGEAHGSIPNPQPADSYDPQSRKHQKKEAPAGSCADVAAPPAGAGQGRAGWEETQTHARTLPVPLPLPLPHPSTRPAGAPHSITHPEPPRSGYPSHPWTLAGPQAAPDVYQTQQKAVSSHSGPHSVDPQHHGQHQAASSLTVSGSREAPGVPARGGPAPRVPGPGVPAAPRGGALGSEARAGGAFLQMEGLIGNLDGAASGDGVRNILLRRREGEVLSEQTRVHDSILESAVDYKPTPRLDGANSLAPSLGSSLGQAVAPGLVSGRRDGEEKGAAGKKPLPPKKRDWMLLDALQGCFTAPAAQQPQHHQSHQLQQQQGARACSSPGPEGPLQLQGTEGSSPDDTAPTPPPLRSCSANGGASSGDDCSEEQPLAAHAGAREGGGRGGGRKQRSRGDGWPLVATAGGQGGGPKGGRARNGGGSDGGEGAPGPAGAKGSRKGSYHRFGTDGFMWSKYSHKRLRNTKTERSYYACVEKDRLACPARKLVDRPQKMFALGDYSCDIVTLEGTHNHPPVGAPEDPNNSFSPGGS